MKLNNRGFAISSILYMALVLFFIIIIALLAMMGGRKNILDKVRKDTYNFINGIVGSGTDSDETLDIAFPTMSDNMIPIVYSPTGITLKADTTGNTNRNWYNYSQRKWANVVLVKEEGIQTRDYYKSAPPGTIINVDDILAYFVWVPRYRYAVNTTTKEVSAVFENKSIAKSTGSGTEDSYYTHPAFTFGGEELNGIWVAKFEASGTLATAFTDSTELTFLPGRTSVSYVKANDMFLNARKMEVQDNIYGFSQEGQNSTGECASADNDCITYCGTIDGDTNNIEPHVLKNTEWGAITLLSQSKYGANGPITINNDISYCTGGECTNYSHLNNQNQSSTGNIYGIYDMVGGHWDFVMGHYGDIDFFDGCDTTVSKYYDKYTSSTGIKGDATNNEGVSKWTTEGDYSFPISSSPFFTRGGQGALGGIYTYYGRMVNAGGFLDSNDLIGFRVSLAIW